MIKLLCCGHQSRRGKLLSSCSLAVCECQAGMGHQAPRSEQARSAQRHWAPFRTVWREHWPGLAPYSKAARRAHTAPRINRGVLGGPNSRQRALHLGELGQLGSTLLDEPFAIRQPRINELQLTRLGSRLLGAIPRPALLALPTGPCALL